MSVEDNIMCVLEMTKLTKQQRIEKMESLIKEFRLEKVRKNLGDRLSGGERRRCENCTLLSNRSKVHNARRTIAGVDPIAVEDIQTHCLAIKIPQYRYSHY